MQWKVMKVIVMSNKLWYKLTQKGSGGIKMIRKFCFVNKKILITLGVLLCLLLLTVPAGARENGGLYVSALISGNNTDPAHPVNNLLDQNPETKWRFASQAIEEWAEITLEKPSLIYGIKLTGSLAQQTFLSLEYEHDERWLPFIASACEKLPIDGLLDLSLDQVVTKKFRIKLKGSDLAHSYLEDIVIFGEEADRVLHKLSTKVSSSVNSAPHYPAEFLIDGNTYTGWRTNPSAYESELLFNLDRVYNIKHINIYFTDQACGDLSVEIPRDNGFRSIGYIPQQSEGCYRLDLNEQEINTAQVRLLFSGYGELGGISEVEIWGYGAYQGRRHQPVGVQRLRELNEPLNLSFEIMGQEETESSSLVQGGLQVLYQCTNNAERSSSIQHQLRIVNTGSEVVNLADLKTRYWFTDEPKKDPDVQIYWASAGREKVTTQVKRCSQNYPQADRYLEIGFKENTGKLMPGAYTEVQIGLNTKNWDVYHQTNDYSFDGTGSGFRENRNYTAYLAGALAWGIEPGKEETPQQPSGMGLMGQGNGKQISGIEMADLEVLYQCITPSIYANSLQHNVKLVNRGDQSVDLKTVNLRYWFTKEPQSPQIANIYWSNLGANKVTASFYSLADELPDADHYLELGFKQGNLQPGAAVEIKLGFNTNDWLDYYQQNDYSFDPNATDYTENLCYTAYVNDALVWGEESSASQNKIFTDQELLLAFADTRNEPVTLALNGTEYNINPMLTVRDYTLYKLQLSAESLLEGENYLRIYPASSSRKLANIFVTESVNDGRCFAQGRGLTDGLLLTAANEESKEIELTGKTLLTEVTVFGKTAAYNNLSALVENNWVRLASSEIREDRVYYREPLLTDRLRVEGASSALGEILILGSTITDRAPELKITWPSDGDIIDLAGWGNKEIEGFIDNPKAVVRINGMPTEQKGHHFSLRLNKAGLRPWESTTLNAVAIDDKNRETRMALTVALGKFEDCRLDQPDQLIYTTENAFTISGRVQKPFYQVKVNDQLINVSGGKFTTLVTLEEGFNQIRVEFIDTQKNISRTYYRQVVRMSEKMFLSLDTISGRYVRESLFTISGTVEGNGEIEVTVNGEPAPVKSGTFISPPIRLLAGENIIHVVAADETGQTATDTLTVYYDNSPPVIGNVTPDDELITNKSVVKVSGEVTDDVALAHIFVNGKAVIITQNQFSLELELLDGWNTITITAQDLAGNQSVLQQKILIDTEAPDEFTPEGPVGWTNDNKPTISFATTDQLSGLDYYQIRVDDGAWDDQVLSPYSFTTELADGERRIYIKAVDKAGNERVALLNLYIDTAPPERPENLRVIPGNGIMVIKWDIPSSDTVRYIVEGKKNDEIQTYTILENEYTDLTLENGDICSYRVWAIDRAENTGLSTEWNEGTVGLAEAQYVPEEGALVEYNQVTLAIPQEVMPAGVAKIEITEIASEYLEEKVLYPRLGPIYEITACDDKGIPLENVPMEQGYLGKIEYDESLIPEGFPKENLGVYYYDPMFDKWFLIESSGVDIENNTIYFLTNHFSSFSVQATLFQDLSPQEYKDAGYSPLKSYSVHEGIRVSPQMGTASTSATELVLPGRNGFDFVLKRHYDTATARSDAFSIGLSGQLGLNFTKPDGNLKDIKEIKDLVDAWKKVNDWSVGGILTDNLKNFLEAYCFNQGDFAYSMGQGWRINLPYIKAANSSVMLCTAEGAMHSINEMQITGMPVYLPNLRTIKFEQHEGDDFTLYVTQGKSPIDFISLIGQKLDKPENILKSRWYGLDYKLVLKDGTVYEMDALGRTTKIIDPSGLNEIKVSYNHTRIDRIVDSMGRVIRFDYQDFAIMPRIERIWVENDPYDREITYNIGGPSLLESAIDAGGRKTSYDYDEFTLMYGGRAGFKVNILTIICNIIGGPIAGLATSIFGTDDITLHANLQIQFVSPMIEMEAPGQGMVKIDYDQPTFIYGSCDVNWFLFIPVSVDFSINAQQRLLTDEVRVYDNSGSSPIRTTRYSYDIRDCTSGTGHQPFNFKTVENDGKKRTVFHFSPVNKRRYRWEDKSLQFGNGPDKLELTFPVTLWSIHVLPLNSKTEFFDAQTNKLLEVQETKYDVNTMRPVKNTLRRGNAEQTVEYAYDNWGNVTYTKDYAQAHGRVTQTRTWLYYLNTNSKPSSDVPWKGIPFSEPVLTQTRRNLVAGQVMENHIPQADGGQTVQYLHTYYGYNELGQRTDEAQWDGSKWLLTAYEYHPDHGSLVKRINPLSHQTLYQYDQHGLPSAVIEKDVKDAKGNKVDLLTHTGYEYRSGWKIWEQNPRGYVTEYEYDALGRTTKIIEPDDNDNPAWDPATGSQPSFRIDNPVTRIEYNDTELYSIVTDPLGNRTKYDFDRLGQMAELIKYQKDSGQYRVAAVTKLLYDGYGNITAITDPNGHMTEYTYDAMGRNIAIIHPQENGFKPRKTMAYDYTTNTLTIIDENNHETIEYYDLQGRVIQRKQYNRYEIIETFQYYDGLGNGIITIDPKGSKALKEYNQLNQLTRIQLPQETFLENGLAVTLSPEQRFAYNDAGFKIKDITSMPGNTQQVIDYEVDAFGRVIRTSVPYTDQGELKTAITETYYDENGNQVRVVDANNTPLPESQQKAFTYTYSAKDLVLTETDPMGNKTTYTYDANGNRLSMTDPRGNSGKYDGDFTIIYQYDDLNRLIEGFLPRSRGDAEKPVVKLTYDARGNLVERMEPDGLKLIYTYSPRNFLLTESMIGSGKTYRTEHFYDLVGNEIRVKDAKGNETTTQYDDLNRPTKITYPERNSEQFEYDENGNQAAFLNGRNYRTEYQYDRYNRLVETKEITSGIKTNYHYDRLGNMTRMTSPLDHTTDYRYDELNRLLEEVNPEGKPETYRYDAVGNMAWRRDRNGAVSLYEYLPNNLVKAITITKDDPTVGQKTQVLEYDYDEAGLRKLARVDGVVTEYNTEHGVYRPDPYGRIYEETKSFTGKTSTVEYQYDVMGRMTGVKYPTGQWVTYEYNNLGELNKVPGLINEAPRYDEGGFLVGVTAANQIATTYEYDRNGRLTILNYNNQSRELMKGYRLGYDGANNIITKNEDTFSYDSLNQLLFANLQGKFEVDGKAETQRVGRVINDFVGNKTLDFAVSKVELIELDYAAGSIGVDLQGTYPVTRVELMPNNPLHRVEARHLTLYSSLDGFAYEQINDWQLEKKDDGTLELLFTTPIPSRYLKVHSKWDERDLTFNPIHNGEFINTLQNMIAVYYQVNQRVEEYQYDAGGNRKQETITLRSSTTRDYSYYPNSSKLMTNGKFAFVYDDNGNLIRKGSNFILDGDTVTFDLEGTDLWIYEYDLLNRLIRVNQDGKLVTEYLYDEAGLRLKKQSQDSTVYYVFNQTGQVLYEEENGEYLEYIYVLGKHFARVDGSLQSEEQQTYFYHTDHLGSTVLVTDEDGEAVWSTEYTPFGGMASTEGEIKKAAKFTGKDLDEDTGLYYFNARWYDSEIGRFISEDPAADPNNPNLYTYCANNPMVFFDPTGMYYEATAAWGSTGWTLAAADTVAPFGDAIYVIGVAGCAVYDTAVLIGDKIPGIILWAKNTAASIKGKSKDVSKNDNKKAQEGAEKNKQDSEVGKNELPKNPDDLINKGWKEVTDPRNKSGSREFENPQTGEKVRFDPGKQGANGWEGKDHYHRVNPNSTGQKDYYLDVDGNPVPKGSKPSHIPPTE